jgi:hypothetical protein
MLVSAGLGGEGVGYDQGATRDAEFSPDSGFLVFTDNALLASPVTTAFTQNFSTNLYAFDVVARRQNLLSINAAGTAPANAFTGTTIESGVEPFSFVVNPAGGAVVFLSTHTDMVAGVTDTPHTLDVFLGMLPAPGTPPSPCGDPVPDTGMTAHTPARPSAVRASDALFILRTAVGTLACQACVCDIDGSGSITATDALVALKIAVGQALALSCPAC